jgi:hypothetical protein
VDSNTITSHIGAQLGRVAPKLELGMIERAAGVTTGLQALHDKLGSLRDRIEGSGACGNEIKPSPCGLTSHLSEAESVLRACHSLLDDIAGKF